MLRLSFDGWTIWPCHPRRFELSTWRLESVAGLLSTRLTSAVYCPLRWRFRTFKMGILAMWMMENLRYLSGHLFLAELSPCRKCHGIYRRRERFANLLFSSLYCHWVKNCRPKKGLKQCLGGLKCSQNTKKNKKTLKVSFKAIFNVHFVNLVSK